MNYIEEAFKIIEANRDQAELGDPIPKDKIEIAQKMLGVTFSPSYRQFLEKYGAGEILGIEVFGIIHDPETDRAIVPNGISLTLDLRDKINMSDQYLMISDNNFGIYYVIDTEQVDENGESPICQWDTGNQVERAYDSFGQFLYISLREALLY